MKRTLIGLFAMFLGTTLALAQSQADAYRLSQTELTGTARFVSMGGAFGALGGDISVMSYNPAGLAIYRSSEVLTTLNLNFTDAKSSWHGGKHDVSKTRFNFSNIGYVGYFPTGNESGLKGWNIGFAYKRVKDYNRNYYMGSLGLHDKHSLADYIATDANYIGYTGNDLGRAENYDPWRNHGWLHTLGYNAGIIQSMDENAKDSFYNPYRQSTGGDNWALYNIQEGKLQVNERGAIDDYDFSMAFNFSDQIFIGATVTLTDLYYKAISGYYENFGKTADNAPHNSDFYLNNMLRTTGTGYSFNLGVLVRPTDFLRLGVAYNSPIWYKMSDQYHADAGARVYTDANEYDREGISTPNGITEYKMRSPDRWIFSAAGIIGQSGLISFDYELSNYKNTRLNPREGKRLDLDEQNRYMKNDFGISHTFKIGAEYKVTPQFAIRAGTLWQTNSIKSHMANGKSEVFTSGTRPNYTLTKGMESSYTFGLGYRFTPNFYMDLACVYNMKKDEVYPFSTLKVKDDKNQIHTLVQSYPGELKTNRTSVYLTFGYKF